MKKNVKSYLYIGLALIVWGELMLFRFRFLPLAKWSYLFFWYGYILFLDAAIYQRRGRSMINSRLREFLVMLPVSTGVWLMFEWYNLYLKNWHYAELPDKLWVSATGSLISFATVIPGVFLTSELLYDVLRLDRVRVKPRKFSRGALTASLIFGALCVTVPLAVPSPASSYLFGFVWLGFYFLLEPINFWLKGDSLLEDRSQGLLGRMLAILIGGAVCGFLWEFWNYWGEAKWIYDVPIASDLKLFEMPVLGFLGFPPFALELFAIYSSLKLLYSFLRRGRAEKYAQEKIFPV